VRGYRTTPHRHWTWTIYISVMSSVTEAGTLLDDHCELSMLVGDTHHGAADDVKNEQREQNCTCIVHHLKTRHI
jgi:hypothetical protein